LNFLAALDLIKARTGSPSVSEDLIHSTVRKLLSHPDHEIVHGGRGMGLIATPNKPKILGQAQAMLFPVSGQDKVHGIVPHTVEVPFKNHAGESRTAHVSIHPTRELTMTPATDPNDLPVNGMHAYQANTRNPHGIYKDHIHHIVLQVPVHDAHRARLAGHLSRAFNEHRKIRHHFHATSPEKERLAQSMRSTLGHELAHAMDPGIEAFHAKIGDLNNSSMRTNRRNQFLGREYPDLHELADHPEVYQAGSGAHTEQARRWSKYVNHPAEIPAWLHQAHREMTTTDAMHAAKNVEDYHGGDGPIRHMDDYSPTWSTIKEELSPKNKRRFLKMAAATHSGIHSGDISAVRKSINAGIL